ncbi:GNAT family N-acetyltransferase [Pseudahrensia aquimaris]|uniref:GNAT family N-acetyltransferase n=1 Tax=Pseudahrensia aquimaris TaxID=744461 RepID=A0ABW3FMG4_9HYPH
MVEVTDEKPDPDDVTIRVVDSMSEIDATAWDECANPVGKASADFPYNPFLTHAFFLSLEESKSAVAETGWLGQHLVMERAGDNSVIGVLPCYLKNHSQGEYVFDHGWADAFERAGGAYYPKLQCAVPFTPATGRRFLVGNGEESDARRDVLAGGLQQVCTRLGVSSAHVTFIEPEEADALEASGYLHRTDQQFHWLNNNYKTFDDFLAQLSSRKRKNIKKERAAALEASGVTIEWLTGDQLTEDVWDIFYRFYVDTGSRKWGRPYLTREFYNLVGQRLSKDILLVMAKRDGRYVAGAINFIGSHTLYGRHWGCVEEVPFLHFEVCYYQAIDYAIANGLDRVEAGAQGGHKLARGYLPQITHSAHYITHPDFRRAVADYLENEKRAVEREARLIAKHGPFKKGGTMPSESET